MEIEASVPEFKKTIEDNKEVAYYIIRLKANNQQWSVEKRYSDIAQLHEDLKNNHGSLPILPPKTIFAIKTYDDIESRRAKLDTYITVG